MADRIKAKAASINARRDALEIVLTFTDANGEPQQVGYAYGIGGVRKFANELIRVCNKVSDAAAVALEDAVIPGAEVDGLE